MIIIIIIFDLNVTKLIQEEWWMWDYNQKRENARSFHFSVYASNDLYLSLNVLAGVFRVCLKHCYAKLDF